MFRRSLDLLCYISSSFHRTFLMSLRTPIACCIRTSIPHRLIILYVKSYRLFILTISSTITVISKVNIRDLDIDRWHVGSLGLFSLKLVDSVLLDVYYISLFSILIKNVINLSVFPFKRIKQSDIFMLESTHLVS